MVKSSKMSTTRNEAKKLAEEYIDIAIVSDDFEKMPLDLAMKILFKATQQISTQIEPVPIPTTEMIDPEIGTIGYTISKTGILL
jgi:predicted nuclease with TOPRIM domain